MKPMPLRQIHLDFHTSPLIPDIGADFSMDDFGKTLKNAHVQHINLFGKCHHGWFYYPSQISAMHPHLQFNLLESQVEACRKYGISYSIYTCVGWNEECASQHPQWQEVSPDGVLGGKPPFERNYYQWKSLCLNNLEYRSLIKAELKEEFENFHPLGFWIDIIQPHECVCQSCREKASKLHLDIEKTVDRQKMARLAQIDYMRDIHAFVISMDARLHVYFNGFPYACDLGDDLALTNKNKHSYVTFMDIESLPSTEWGYAHFPIAVNYVNKFNTHDVIMMNGKFHLAWGDFGTLRNEEALEYECFRAAANGAGVCVGDQLHPSGRLDTCVYQRIGRVFTQLDATEKWCRGSEKIAQIGVYTTTPSAQANGNGVNLTLEGAYRLMTEGKYQYDILDLNDPINKYELLILPDQVLMSAEAARKIDTFVKCGGRLLVTGNSSLDTQGKFMLDCLPVCYQGPGLTAPRYMDFHEDVFPGVPDMKTIAYSGGACVKAKSGAHVLCETVDSYFDRSEAHFCSHRQTPPKPGGNGEPCIVINKNVAYVSNFLFSDLAEYGVKVYKDILNNLIERLLLKPLVRSDLPAYAEVTVRKLKRSLIVHILNYLVQRKCKQLDTIEEMVPLYDRNIRIRTYVKPLEVRLVPQDIPLPFTYDDGYTSIMIERLYGWTLLEVILPE